jgi:hypothetical protein
MPRFHEKQVPLWYISAVTTSEEWAWAAAIFEGAGTIVTVNGGRDLRLALHLTDADLAVRYAAIVGARLLGPYPGAPTAGGVPRRPSYRCNLNGRRATAALTEMWPWLGERRRSRLVALGFAIVP